MMRSIALLLIALASQVQVEAFQMQMNMPGMVSKKVIVTGAAGRTGSIVFSLLNKDPRFDAVGLVRSEASAKKLIAKTSCNLEEIVVSDVTQMEFEKEAENPHPWPYALDGAEAMVICTSAVPQISKVSIIKAMLKIPMNILTPKKKAINFRDLQFKYKPGQYPEMVDYVGQKKQIDLAKKMGVKHVVLVSSMGGLDKNNFLNQIGKDKNGEGHGDILIWKRKAERYLCLSGLQYTILHPGGLVDPPEANKMQLVLDVDDKLMQNEKKSIARTDVANLCIAALTESGGQSVSFDCIGRQLDEGEESVSSAEETLKAFLKEGKTCDYALGPKGM
mmetsp:Transcript_23579/g.35753  ORF Transcript_23579/g.35753 Transcript_23579/m.35753 type:complete len:333 (+) Transcript_23579:100-1098(+)|eukprot:scaffold190_cov109-Skeletonema_dohrnii-CCMP3373.AAC.17